MLLNKKRNSQFLLYSIEAAPYSYVKLTAVGAFGFSRIPGECLLQSVHDLVCLQEKMGKAERIKIKHDIWEFYEKMYSHFNFDFNRITLTAVLHNSFYLDVIN
jgi:hypothetical protein